MNDKICGYFLDKQQEEIVTDESERLLVVAGAGSGKTLTILGKINYLIKYKNYDPSSILCISFTRDSSFGLKEKIKNEFNIDMPVYTFHKLALNILGKKFDIADNDLLYDIIYKFFLIDILDSKKHMILFLRYFGINGLSNIKDKYIKFYKNNSTDIYRFSKSIEMFIRLFKCNNFKLGDFSLFLKNIRKTIFYKKFLKEKIFLIFTLNIFIKYEKYLFDNNEIDFDDMIIKASDYVLNNDFSNNIRYVIIDEYQDTSIIRFNLIKNILDKTYAKLMVVGDDFQSIYRFNGCSLSLFLNFSNMFDNSKVLKIETTYRNSQELVDVAGDFVMKNKSQIKKNLLSNKHLVKPIKIIKYVSKKSILIDTIKDILSYSNGSIMILGRNNNDINYYIDSSFKLLDDGTIIINGKDFNIRYLTVHKSKGLEADNVIVINLINAITGFPSQIGEEKIFRLVSNSESKFLFDEERRLFYVAITRTKNYVYLLVDNYNESIFVKELEKNYKNNIEIIKKVRKF